MVLDHRGLRRLLLARLAAIENHLKGNCKEQQPTCDAERADGDTHRVQNRFTSNRKDGQNAEGDESAAERRASPLQPGHAVRQP